MKKFEVKKIFSRESAERIGHGIDSGVKKVIPLSSDSPERWFFKVLMFSFLGLMVLVGLVTLAAFLLNLKEPENVTVPEVTGLELSDAIDQVQRVGLSVKVVQEFYSNPDTRGKIMKQDPVAGSGSKTDRPVTLYYSKGASDNAVGDYRGRNIEAVISDLKGTFPGEVPMISVGSVTKVNDSAEPGTILSQDPTPGSRLERPVRLSLLVSKGLDETLPVVPGFTGLPYMEVMDQLARSGLPFEWRLVEGNSDHQGGAVFEQNPAAGSNLPQGQKVILTMMPPMVGGGDQIFGLFEMDLPDYTVPVDMSVTIYDPQGDTRVLYRFKHAGGRLSFPYYLKDGTEINVLVFEKVIKRYMVGSRRE